MNIKTRISALALSISYIFGTNAFALNSGYTTNDIISHGTTHYQTIGQSDKGPQKVNYIDYKPNSQTSPVVVYGNKLYGKSTFSQAASFLEKQGKNVIAGINADYFVVSTGIPLGLVINNGTLVSSDAWQNAIGFKEDGSAIIGKPGGNISMFTQTANITIDYFNKSRTTSGVYLYDSNFSDTTKTSTDGTSIIFTRENDSVLKFGNDVPLVVRDIVSGSSPINIADNEFVLSIDKKGPISKLPTFKIGERLTLRAKVGNTNWNNVLYATGAKETLIENGIMNSALDNKTTNPRSAIGIRADGSVVLYEVDGRQSGISLGLTLKELAFELSALGCVSAINLDGGGSSIFGVKKPSKNELSIVNTPSANSQRPSANFIMLVNKTNPIGDLANLSIDAENNFLLKGASTKITYSASDSNFYSVPLSTKPTFKIESDIGFLNEHNNFVASKPGTVEIKASIDDITATEKLFVLDKVDNIKVSSLGSEITSISLSNNGSIDLDASPSLRNISPIASTDKSFDWSVSGDIGTISSDGNFLSNGKSGNGTISVSYLSYKKDIPISIGIPPMKNTTIITDFETLNPFTSNSNTEIETNLSFVDKGMKSLKIDYVENEKTTLNIENSTLSPIFKSIQLAIYGNNSNSKIIANFKDSNGNNSETEIGNINFAGYKTFITPIPSGSSAFTGFSIYGGSSDTIYIDQIVKTENIEIDKTAPTIDILDVPSNGEIDKTTAATFKITKDNKTTSVNDDLIKIYFNGNALNFTNRKSDGLVSIDIPQLTSELNRLTIQTTDGSGNINRLSFDITLSSPSPSVFSDTNGHWATTFITFANTNNLVKGSTLNSSLVFRPNDNLTRAEFAVIMSRFLKLNTDIPIENDRVEIVGQEQNSYPFLPFSDNSKIPSWAAGAIKAVNDAGIMTGSRDEDKLNFNPNNSITRAEAMAVIGRTFPKGYTIKSLDFADTSKVPSWAIEHAKLLISLEIINGYPDNTIKPANNIKRGEIAKILFNLY